MSGSSGSRNSGVRRRALLASAAAGAAGLAGCLSRFRTVRSQDVPDQISLDILTLPGDDDAVATQIGRHLSSHLEQIGVDTNLVLFPEDELRREVLINQEYDLFVSAHPNVQDLDTLRPLLHSSFVSEIGWQNPFEFTDINTDEYLEKQRKQDGSARRETAVDLQYELVRQQPFIPVAIPDTVRASRSDRYTNWESFSGTLSQSVAQIERVDAETETLRFVSTDGRVTQNLNPIAIEYRNKGQITGLLYDTLGKRYSGEIQPWAAESWEFFEDGTETAATVTLQPDLQFHDGTPLTATDVVFTVEFLQDTSLGEFEIPVPAPQFRGRSSLVDEITAIDERTVEMTFPETSRATAMRALTLPIFPQSDWEDTAVPADVAGVELSEAVTEALVRQNEEPVGSGLFQFESSTENEELILKRNENHVLNREDESMPVQLQEQFSGGLPFERLSVRIVRSADAALGLLVDGEVDAAISDLDPAVVPRVGREPEVELHIEQSQSLYLVGCNTVREPLGNPHFRRLIARLVDKEHIRRDAFGGFARPTASPLAGTEWLPTDLRWDGSDPELPFFGTDGSLDVEAIRDHLRDAGFEFGSDGQLLEQ